MALILKGKISLDWSSVDRAMKGTQGKLRTFVTVTGRGFADATARLVRFGAILGGIGIAAAGWAVKVGASFEMLRLRMAVAFGGGEAAAKALQETVALAIQSPAAELEPLVRARIMLANFGVRGIEAMEALAATAMMTGREIEDVASTIGSLETEPLRRLGITSRSRSVRTPDGGMTTTFNITALDTFGRKVNLVVDGIDAARVAVIRLLGMKYTGAMGSVANTLTGSFRAVSDQAKTSLYEIMRQVNEGAIPALKDLNDWFARAHAAGKFTEYGQRIAKWSNDAINSIRALVMGWNSLSEASREQLENVLKYAAVFGVAWHTGFVQVFLKSMGYLITTNKYAFGVFVTLMGGLLSYVAGNKIGKAMEASFGLSGMLAKFYLFSVEFLSGWRGILDSLVAYTRGQAEVMWKMILIPGYALSGGLTRAIDEAGKNGAAILDATIIRGIASMAKLKEEFAMIDEMAKAEGIGGDRPGFAKAMADEWMTKGGWSDTMKLLVPAPILKALEELIGKAAEFKKSLPGYKPSELPKVGDPFKQMKDGAEAAGEEVKGVGEEIEKVVRLTAPLRGFATGSYGVSGINFDITKKLAAREAAKGLPAVSPSAAVSPLTRGTTKPASGAAVGTGAGEPSVASKIDTTNKILGNILQAKAMFSFA